MHAVVNQSINLTVALDSLGGAEGMRPSDSQVTKLLKAVGLSAASVGQGSGDAERGTGTSRGGLGAYAPFNELLENLKQGLELVFVFDSTSSMEPEINMMKLGFMQFGARLLEVLPNTRIACVSYKDTTDDPIVAYSALTADLNHINAFLSRIEAYGGGYDIPETVELGLWRAIRG